MLTVCGFAVFINYYNQWLFEFDDWKQLMQVFQLVEKNKEQI